jgi:hypothetical protein
VGHDNGSLENKIYHKDCMTMPLADGQEEPFSILDFNSELDMELKIDKDLQIELYKSKKFSQIFRLTSILDVVIKLYTKFPKIKKYEEGEEQPEEPEVIIEE